MGDDGITYPGIEGDKGSKGDAGFNGRPGRNGVKVLSI